jgi:hypothetical protein
MDRGGAQMSTLHTFAPSPPPARSYRNNLTPPPQRPSSPAPRMPCTRPSSIASSGSACRHRAFGRFSFPGCLCVAGWHVRHLGRMRLCRSRGWAGRGRLQFPPLVIRHPRRGTPPCPSALFFYTARVCLLHQASITHGGEGRCRPLEHQSKKLTVRPISSSGGVQPADP